jgi:pyrroline-5-carboxylate reductase
MNNPDVIMIGCGNMGAALLAGYLRTNPTGRVIAVDPDTERARSLLSAHAPIAVLGSVQELGDARPGMTILAVKPQMLPTVLPSLAGPLAADGLILSIAAGVSSAFLRQHLASARIVRAMPNTPALVGAGFTALWGDETVQAEDRSRCEGLFGAVGQACWLSAEEEIDAVTAVSGSGPAYFFAIAEAMTKAGTSLGLPGFLVDRMVQATMEGAAAMLRDPAAMPSALKAAVRSPNGTTDAALRIFEDRDALDGLIAQAIQAAYVRAIALRNAAR